MEPRKWRVDEYISKIYCPRRLDFRAAGRLSSLLSLSCARFLVPRFGASSLDNGDESRLLLFTCASTCASISTAQSSSSPFALAYTSSPKSSLSLSSPKGSSNAALKCRLSITPADRLGPGGEGGDDRGDADALGRRRCAFGTGERVVGEFGKDGVDDDCFSATYNSPYHVIQRFQVI